MARGRHQRGWLRTEKRSEGEMWMLHFRTTRESDGNRVEHKIPVGLVRELPSARAPGAHRQQPQGLSHGDVRWFGSYVLEP